MPIRPRSGPNRGELFWKPLNFCRVLHILHNPAYAGAFAYGRSRSRRRTDGKVSVRAVPRRQWQVLIHDHHPGYITWDRFERNQQRLRENARAHGPERSQGPPREGPALLQGLALCGTCGRSMTVRYRKSGASLLPNYICDRDGIERARPICQTVAGDSIDRAVADLLVEQMTPRMLELAVKRYRTRSGSALKRPTPCGSLPYGAPARRRIWPAAATA